VDCYLNTMLSLSLSSTVIKQNGNQKQDTGEVCHAQALKQVVFRKA